MAVHAHDHGHGGQSSDRSASRTALRLTLVLTAGFTVAEVIGGLVTNSLALLADAAHMLSDTGSIAIALFAVVLAARPANTKRTFGYKRAEILAAFFNGLTLIAVSIWIFIEAAQRFGEPPEILGAPMLVVAILGVAVNLVAAWILHRGGDDSLNVSAAFRHVLADLAGSVGVVIAALVILATGWTTIDPLISVLIAVLVLASSWSILRDSVQILLEASPREIDVAEVGRAMAETPGVTDVHDLHVWTITSGFPALAAHVLVGEAVDCHAKRQELERLLHDRFELEHTTLQVDHSVPELLQLEAADGTRIEQSSGALAPGSDQQTFLFADLAGFTALTDARGDTEAVATVEHFVAHTHRLLSRHRGEQIKTIGDAVMLRMESPADAVQLALDLAHHEMAQHGHPAVRIGIHRGPAVERDGDWLGATVNIAARLTSMARGGEILASAETAAAAGEPDCGMYVPRGKQALRNVGEPVPVVEVRCQAPAKLSEDPVCKLSLDPARSFARLMHDGREYHFCSAECRQTFVAEHPEARAPLMPSS